MAKKKKGFLDGYETYDPSVEGYGNAAEYVSAFRARMGVEEAQTILGNEDPWKVLRINSNEPWAAVKSAFRKLIMKYHPDRNTDKEKWATKMTQKVTAAFTLIKTKRGK